MHTLSRHRALVAVLVSLAALYLPWSASSHPGDLDGDSATYYLTARHFAPYLGAEATAAHAAQLSQFPPLYPLALALTGGAASVPMAHAVTVLCLLAALAAFYGWLLALGLTRGWAAVATGLLGLLPGTWLLALSLLSEPLYLALSLAALTLLARAGTDSRAHAWAALAIAAAILTRSAGLALLPALAFALWRERPRGSPWILLLAVAPPLAWSLVPRGQAGYLAEFSSAGEMLAWLPHGLDAFVRGIGDNLLHTGTGSGRALACGIVLLGVALVRVRPLRPDLAYVGAYTGLIALWPYPTHATRFAWVLVPLLLGYAFLGAQLLGRRLRTAPHAPAALLAAALALALAPALVAGIARWRDPLAAPHAGLRHLRAWYAPDAAQATPQALLQWHLMAGLAQLGERVPPDDCVLALGWPTVTFHTGRVAWELPDESADDAALRAAIARAGCGHFVLLGIPNPIVPTPFYPDARLPGELEPLGAYRADVAGQDLMLLVLARPVAARASPE